jgi:hypothetical protein
MQRKEVIFKSVYGAFNNNNNKNTMQDDLRICFVVVIALSCLVSHSFFRTQSKVGVAFSELNTQRSANLPHQK